MTDFDGMTRKFLLGETKQAGARAYLQAIKDGLKKLRPSSQSQAVMIENMLSQLRSVTKEFISLREKVSVLEEKLNVLEESKTEE
jgi:polyhydroxyalkanoate synthesis regulator phasin